MRVTIIPHGALCDTWPTGFQCEADTAHEAMRAYEQQFDLRCKTPGVKWAVRVAGYNTETELKSPLRSSELHVVPDFSGGGGVIKIVIGAVLVVLAVVAAVFQLYPLAATLAISGVTMLVGGILELMTPAPKTSTKDQGMEGRYLGNVKNTTKIGTRIPIGYGRYPVYGQYLSFGVASTPSADPGTAALRRQAAGFAN